jgi:GH18 family chitinase
MFTLKAKVDALFSNEKYQFRLIQYYANHCGRSHSYYTDWAKIDSPKYFVPDEIEGWLDYLSPLLSFSDKPFQTGLL